MKKYTALSLSRYLAELSGKKPVPGGGSVSAYVGCLGMGLARMVAAIGIKRVSPESKAAVRRAMRVLTKTMRNTLQVVDLDPKVYQTVLKSYQRSKTISDPKKKERLVEEALENSFRLQADLALLVAMAKKAAQSLEGLIRGSIMNDLKISLMLLDTAFYGAFETARINVVYLKEPQRKERDQHALVEFIF
jgi:glutamate formiminotransferase/formiminotetrahydrofolate cyclodeaminase